MKVSALAASLCGVLATSHLSAPQSPPSGLQMVALVGEQKDLSEST